MQPSTPNPTNRQLTTHTENFGLIGSSAAIERLKLQIHRIGPHFRSVLLTGETGTGKDLVAYALHTLGSGANTPFVVRNASALSENLLESDAFYQRGTLFLDEVGEMPRDIQDSLLHALQQQDASRPGPRKISLRIVAATHRDLRPHVQSGNFSRELYERLSMVEIPLPSLRSHLEDLEELAHHFVHLFAHQYGKSTPKLSSSVLSRLLAHAWPGNIHEFENVIGYAVMQCDEEILEVRHLPPHMLAKEPSLTSFSSSHLPSGEPQRLDDMIRHHVSYVLERCGGNKLRAAECLGISRSTLYRLLENKDSF